MSSVTEPRGLRLKRREIGRIVGPEPGPTVIIVAGMHGNEPAGIAAAERVFARLGRGDVKLRGELLVLAGNVAALGLGVRYQTKDLNRIWKEAAVRDLLARKDEDAEDCEQRELYVAIEAAVARSRGQVHLADFHTSSANGIPFILIGDTPAQRQFVGAIPIPIVMGLEAHLEGVLASYWTERGCVTFSIEGGQHKDPGSLDNLEAVLWLALEQAGFFARGAFGEVSNSVSLLDEKRSGLPRMIEVLSRRAITEDDAFRMEPGFRNLDRAPRGQLLARDKNGEIRAPSDGMVILPLYQGLGNDGFFWGRAVESTAERGTRSREVRNFVA